MQYASQNINGRWWIMKFEFGEHDGNPDVRRTLGIHRLWEVKNGEGDYAAGMGVPVEDYPQMRIETQGASETIYRVWLRDANSNVITGIPAHDTLYDVLNPGPMRNYMASKVAQLYAAATKTEVNEDDIVGTIQRGLVATHRAGAKIGKMAEACGLSPNTVSNYMYGLTSYPRWHTTVMLAHYLGYRMFMRKA